MDLKTELLMLFGGNFLILLLLAAYQKKNADPALRYHFIAILLSFFMILFGALSAVSSLWIFPFLCSIFLMLNAYFEGLALVSVADTLEPWLKRYLLISLIAGIVLYAISFVASPHAYIRVIIISAAEAILLTPPAVLMLWKRRDTRLGALLGVLTFLLIGVFVIREIDAVRIGPELILLGPSLGEALSLPGFFAYLIIGGVGIILLCKEKSDQSLLRLAHYDEGSAALNRHGFIAEYDKAFDKALYDNSPFVVLLAGIDNLSLLDEEYGYKTADQIIRFSVDSLGRLAGRDGFVGRLYGSEFIVFRPNCGLEESERLVADLDSLLKAGRPEDIEFSLTAAAVHFECPNSKVLDFPTLYAVCAPFFREARKAGPGGRVVRSA